MSTEIKKPLNNPSTGSDSKNALEDLPAEAQTLTAEAAEQVAGGRPAIIIRLDVAPEPASASGAMKTIAAAQTDY